jgi:hypothetical protein
MFCPLWVYSSYTGISFIYTVFGNGGIIEPSWHYRVIIAYGVIAALLSYSWQRLRFFALATPAADRLEFDYHRYRFNGLVCGLALADGPDGHVVPHNNGIIEPSWHYGAIVSLSNHRDIIESSLHIESSWHYCPIVAMVAFLRSRHVRRRGRLNLTTTDIDWKGLVCGLVDGTDGHVVHHNNGSIESSWHYWAIVVLSSHRDIIEPSLHIVSPWCYKVIVTKAAFLHSRHARLRDRLEFDYHRYFWARQGHRRPYCIIGSSWHYRDIVVLSGHRDIIESSLRTESSWHYWAIRGKRCVYSLSPRSAAWPPWVSLPQILI